MYSTNSIKGLIVPQSKIVEKSIVINDLTYCVQRVVNFNIIVFPKNGHICLEIDFVNYDNRKKIKEFLNDCGFKSFELFIQFFRNYFFIDTDRCLGRFKVIVIDDNYRIFGTL